jgi:gas vesicle protein
MSQELFVRYALHSPVRMLPISCKNFRRTNILDALRKSFGTLSSTYYTYFITMFIHCSRKTLGTTSEESRKNFGRQSEELWKPVGRTSEESRTNFGRLSDELREKDLRQTSEQTNFRKMFYSHKCISLGGIGPSVVLPGQVL